MIWRRVLALAVLMGSTACARDGAGVVDPPSKSSAAAIPAPTPPVADSPAVPVVAAPPPIESLPQSFAPLAKRANPAVATVRAHIERRIPGRRRAQAEGLGTAFVYDENGFLLTNNHVIEDAVDLSVTFFDGESLPARVVGRDKHTDIAVISIDKKGLPVVPLGDSDAMSVGDWVVAIGNPFGLSHTVSVGILSARGRTTEDVPDLDPAGYFDFLQTDASINPGNSGGPLLDVRGQVVGINTAIRANANGIGFAIPINMVKQLLPMLIRDGKITRSALGVGVDAVGPTQATLLHRPDRKGAWIKYVMPGSPAERAGLAANDVIVAFEGEPIDSPNELRWLASIAGVGRPITLRVARLERSFDLKVTLGELQDADDPD